MSYVNNGMTMKHDDYETKLFNLVLVQVEFKDK